MNVYPKLKRLLDVIVGAIALTVCAPVLAIAAILIKIDSAGPVFFRQRRLGRNGGVFLLYKLRSMYDRPQSPERQTYTDDPEVTRVGAVLRRLKIDELPQLWNVVCGDMSLIGPRPALPDQLGKLPGSAIQRLNVRPGLTGLAQVHGNVFLSWRQRWRYDVLYVQRMSLRLDCWIVCRTVLVLACGEEHFFRTPKPRIDSRGT